MRAGPAIPFEGSGVDEVALAVELVGVDATHLAVGQISFTSFPRLAVRIPKGVTGGNPTLVKDHDLFAGTCQPGNGLSPAPITDQWEPTAVQST